MTFYLGGFGNLAGIEALSDDLLEGLLNINGQGSACFSMVMFLIGPFGILTGIYTLYFLFRIWTSPAILVDTHADVKWWRSILAIHSYFGALVPCHYRCAMAHALMGATHVTFLTLMLLTFYLNVKPKNPLYEYALVILACMISHCIRPPLNSGYFWWRWRQDSVSDQKKANHTEAVAHAKMSYFKAMDTDQGFRRKSLDVLDEVEFDSSPGNRGKAYKVDSDETVAFGPSSDNPDYGDFRGKNFSPNSYSAHGDGESWDNVNSDELAFVGLFRPEGASPVSTHGRGGAGKFQQGNKNMSSYSSQRGEELDLNNFSDVGSEDVRDLEAEDYEGVYDDVRSEQNEKNLFLFGHLAADPFEDVEARGEQQRSAKAAVRKAAAGQRPAEQPPASKAAQRNSMRNIWDSSALRGNAAVPRDSEFDYRKTRKSNNEQNDDLWNRNNLDFGGTMNSGGEDEGDRYAPSDMSSRDGMSIATVATAGNSMIEADAGLPVKIDTRFLETFIVNLVIFLLTLIGCHLLSTRLSKLGMCVSFPNSLGIAILLDILVVETGFLGLVLLFRFLNSEDEDNTMYSELHPYEGEERGYGGLGDPDEALKK